MASKCQVTATAIARSNILIYKMSVAKIAEYPIPSHNTESENAFDFIVIPFPLL